MALDLKIKDVAELLNVSETTVRRLVKAGEIPAYRMTQQYRFNRTEIEAWVMNRRVGTERGLQGSELLSNLNEAYEIEDGSVTGGSKQFNLYRAIHRGGVFHNVPGNSKEEVIRNTMKSLAINLNLDSEVLTDLLLDREKLMPTSLNNGIGVPHTRDFLLRTPHDLVVVAFPKKPIEYGALDGQPVHTLFFLFACKDKKHLHLLAKIAHLSSLSEALKMLQGKPPKEQLLEFVKTWESKIP